MARRRYRNRGHLQEERFPAARPKAPDSPDPEPAPAFAGEPAVIRRKPACACGGTCPRCSGEDGIKALSKVGPANHPMERQADRAAEKVTGMSPPAPESSPGRGAGSGPDSGTRTGSGTGTGPGSSAGPATSRELATGGDPLAPATKDFFEPRFGRDFSSVRLHEGDAAREENDRFQARAFTYGDHIWLGRGAQQGPNPLLAHELAHVAQNQDADEAPLRRKEVEESSAETGAGPGDAEPMSLTSTVDTGELSGSRLEAEVMSLRNWMIEHADRAGDAEYQHLSEELSRLEKELGSRQTLMTGTDLLVAEGDLRFLNQLGAGSIFFTGMVGGLVYEVSPKQLERFAVKVIDPPLMMRLGMDAGVLEGVGMDLLSNLEGLAMLAQLAQSLTPQQLVLSVMEEQARMALDASHRALRLRQAQLGQEMVMGLLEFMDAIRKNPRLLYARSAELGREVGVRAGEWFNDEFMALSDFQQGRQMGNVAGIILTEILLLFLGPEEWVARGVAAEGQLVRVSARLAEGAGRLSRTMIRIVEELPGLARVLRAAEELAGVGRGGVRVAEEAAGVAGAGGRIAETTGAASDLVRATEESSEVLHGAAEASQAAPAAPAAPATSANTPTQTPTNPTSAAPATPAKEAAEAAPPAAPSATPEPSAGNGSGTGPIREVIEGGGNTTPPREGHLSLVPEEAGPRVPDPEAPVPEAQALPVPEEEVLDLAAGAEGMSTRPGPVNPDVPRASTGDEGPGGKVVDFPGGEGARGSRGAGGTRGGTSSGTGGGAGGEPGGGGPEPAAIPAARPVFQRMRLEELVDDAGNFVVRPGAEIPIARLEEFYQAYLARGGTADRATWARRTRLPRARRILNRILERDWAAQAAGRAAEAERLARRAARVAEARQLVRDPNAWRMVEWLQERCPALREWDLIPVRRNRMSQGIWDEAMGTDQALYGFEAMDNQGRRIQIDGFDDMGRMVENKSRAPIGHIERETDKFNFARRELALQMRRQLEFVEEAGLPRPLVWQTDLTELADELSAIVREEGLGSRVQIVDLSAHVDPGGDIPFGTALDFPGTLD